MDWHWFQNTLLKSAVLAGPAIATLALWMKRGVNSRTFYRTSWANPIAHLLWLALVTILGLMSESQIYRAWIPTTLPANVFFALPFLLALCSFVLCAAAIFLKAGERGFAACTNGLMSILWLSVVVAPN